MGTQLPSPKKGSQPPIFGPRLLWQTAAWVKMTHGMDVGLDSGHIVLDGDPAPLPQKWGIAPIFGPCLLWPKGWMDQNAT